MTQSEREDIGAEYKTGKHVYVGVVGNRKKTVRRNAVRTGMTKVKADYINSTLLVCQSRTYILALSLITN